MFKSEWINKQFDFGSADGRIDALNAYSYFNENSVNAKNNSELRKLIKQAKNAGYKFITIQHSNGPRKETCCRYDLIKEDFMVERILLGESIRKVLLSEAAKIPTEQIPLLDVEAIIPDQKDYDRALVLKRNLNISDASKMAKLITDPYKLVRRSKAVVQTCVDNGRPFVNIIQPFLKRLKELGFTDEQIELIKNS